MSLSPYTVVVFSQDTGNVVPFTGVEIRERNSDGSSGPYAAIYTNSTGSTPITQPGATTNSRGTLQFYAAADGYNVEYTVDGQTIVQPVDVGLTADELESIASSYKSKLDASSDPSLSNGQSVLIGDSGESSMWDVFDASLFVADGDDVVAISGTSSVLVKRSVKPTVSFIFDDGYTSAVDSVVPLFKSKGITCGFAVSAALMDSSSPTYATIAEMLQAQYDGFEIINHALDPTPIGNTTLGEPFARNQINGNYDKLVQFGFDVKSYVAGNGVLAPEYIKIVKERHASAYTTVGNGLQLKPIQPYSLHRESLFSLGVTGAKALIDSAVKSRGWIAFYDHDPAQVGFPNSMNLTDLEEVVDYALEQGCDIVNPSQAANNMGEVERRKNLERIDNSNREQGLSIVNQNLLRDPWYKTINEPYSGWGDGFGTGDGTFTIANRKNGNFGNEIQLTIGSNGTVADGTYIYQTNAIRRESSFFPTSGNLTFSCEPYLTNTGFSDNFELTIGVNQRKASDNSIVASVETDPLIVDTRARKYGVTITPADYSSATYFQIFYRITEKTTGVGGAVLMANPKFEQGERATRYTDDAPLDINDWDFAEGTIDCPQTAIPIGVFTPISLSPVNKNFWQIVNNQFLCRDTGFYSFELVVSSVAGSTFTNARQLVEVYKNGVSDGKRESNTVSGPALNWKSSITKYMKSGDTLEWRLYQDQTGSINTEDSVYSFLRVCKIG